MDRRSAIKLGGAILYTLAPKLGFAQLMPDSIRRAAIVIGVDNAGNLASLRGAASGATKMGDFFETQGFDVYRFVDKDGAIIWGGAIFETVNKLVESGSLHQLVIYFAGHGFLVGDNEYWMLSGAPDNPNEAITVLETRNAAPRTGITNVVLISDACRSLPNSLSAQGMHGQLIFPNKGDYDPDVTVDTFFATLPAAQSYEVPPVEESSEEYDGIYTRVFLEVFQNPPLEIQHKLPDGHWVITNRKLRHYLRSQVPIRAQEEHIKLFQVPQAFVTSDEPWNIGRTRPPTRGAPKISAAAKDTSDVLGELLVNVGEVAASAVGWEGVLYNQTSSETIYQNVNAGLTLSVERQAAHVEEASPTIVVYDVAVNEVIVREDASIELETRQVGILADQSVQLIRLKWSPSGDPINALIILDNGHVVPVPIWHGFNVHIYANAKGLVDIHYSPGTDSDLHQAYINDFQRLSYLRALASGALKQGTQFFQGNREDRDRAADELAEQIRLFNGIDPNLGILTAYAYNDALLDEHLKSIAKRMRFSQNFGFFDVEMLVGSLADAPGEIISRELRAWPFCPVLRRGWELLRVKGVDLHPLTAAARPHLQDEFWTSFSFEAIDLLKEPILSGEL